MANNSLFEDELEQVAILRYTMDRFLEVLWGLNLVSYRTFITFDHTDILIRRIRDFNLNSDILHKEE